MWVLLKHHIIILSCHWAILFHTKLFWSIIHKCTHESLSSYHRFRKIICELHSSYFMFDHTNSLVWYTEHDLKKWLNQCATFLVVIDCLAFKRCSLFPAMTFDVDISAVGQLLINERLLLWDVDHSWMSWCDYYNSVKLLRSWCLSAYYLNDSD